MHCWLSLFFLVCVACTEPSLQVEFLMPEGGQVQGASLKVVVPPAGEPFSCDDLAFGAVDEERIRVNTVEEVVLQQGAEVSLVAIPRKNDKLLLAQGFDEGGERVVAGCAAYGVIEDKEHISIQGEVVTVATIPDFDATNTPGPNSEVRVTDVYGSAIEGIEVRWTRTAAGTGPISGSAVSDTAGLVVVTIEPPPLPGPVAIEVHAKWARTSPPVIVGFRDPSLLLAGSVPNSDDGSLRNPEEIYVVGRIGPNGETGLAAMGNPGAGLFREVYISYYDSELAAFRSVVSEPLPAAAVSLLLLSGPTRDRIFSTSSQGLVEVAADGSLAVQPLGGPLGLVRRFLPMGDCSVTGQIQGALAVLVDGSTRAIDSNGKLVNTMFSGANALGTPIASGCVSSGDALHRVVAYVRDSQVYLLADLDGPRSGSLGVVASGIGFTNATETEDALILGTVLGIEGTDIARFRILPLGDDSIDVERVTTDATLTFAQSIDSGDFDNDGTNDVVAVLAFGDKLESTEYRIYVSLGLESSYGRVAGVSTTRIGARPRVTVRDFDDDGYQDILVASNGTFEIYSMAPF